MPRAPKKKTVKKKVASKSRPSRTTKAKTKSKAEVDPSEFDAWAEQQNRVARCSTCARDDVSTTLNALLESMIRKRAYKVTILEIRRMLEKKHPDAVVGQRGLERHLRYCVRDLYDKARGRRNG